MSVKKFVKNIIFPKIFEVRMRATFLARILGNFVPHRENFRKYYSHDSNSHSFQLDNCHLKAITVHFIYQNSTQYLSQYLDG